MTTEQQAIQDLIAENARLRAALEPFAAFSRIQARLGGNHPKTGCLYGLQTGTTDEAELTVEHLREAEDALATVRGPAMQSVSSGNRETEAAGQARSGCQTPSR